MKLWRRLFAGWGRPKPIPELQDLRREGVPPQVWVQGPEAVERWRQIALGWSFSSEDVARGKELRVSIDPERP